MFKGLPVIFVIVCLFPSSATAQGVTDSLGFHWDFASNGSVNDGSDDAFDGGMQLQVNGSSFGGSGQGVDTDGLIVFGPETMGGVVVTRHVILSEDPPGLVYAESFHNPSKTDTITVSPLIYTDFGDSATPQVKNNDDGKMFALMHMHRPNRPLIAFHFGDADTEYLPMMSGSSDTYQFSFPPMEIKAGKTQSIGYFVGQRRDGGNVFNDEEAFQKSILHISDKKSFSFLNLPVFGLYDTGKLKLVKRAATDFIHTLKKDRVYGKLLTNQFMLETAVGKRTYKASEIVNAVRFGSESYSVAADDGSVLEGKLSPDKVKFELSGGAEGEIDLKNIQVLVPREPEPEKANKRKSSEWFEFKKPIFSFVSQDRLTGDLVSETIKVQTSIGQLDVPVKSIQKIEMEQGKNQQQNFITMSDGQSFTGFIYDDIEVKIFDGSTKKISPRNLKTIFFNGQAEPRKELPVDHPFLSLSERDHVLVELVAGQSALELVSVFGKSKIDPEQIRKLESSPGLAASTQVTFWDGSTLTGELASKKVLVRIFGEEREVPVGMIREFHNPMAMPPEKLRKKYLALIDQLGHKAYSEREKAYLALKAEKDSLKGLLKRHLDKVGPEAKSKLFTLLPEKDRKKYLGDAQKGKRGVTAGNGEKAVTEEEGKAAPDAEEEPQDMP